MDAPVFGIDLGTTNSLIAACFGERVELIKNALGDYLTPSAVALGEDGAILVGRAAVDRQFTHPNAVATVFKRVMGSNKRIRLGGREFSPEELSAFVLKSLVADAESATGLVVNEAVISVPAYFNDTQRKATRVAAEIAGIKVTRLVNEPTAAALAFGIHQAADERSFLVFDLGGGTFDVSIVEMFDDVVEVKASTGDNYLGGEDFNAVIVADMAKKLGLDSDAVALHHSRLNHAAEQIKRQLSASREASVTLALPGVQTNANNPDNADSATAPPSYRIDEAAFTELVAPLMVRLRNPIERALRDSRIDPKALNDVVLVGGATRMPLVRKLVARMFGRFPNVEQQPDHAIAIGAATLAAMLSGGRAFNEALMTDVCPYSLGVEVSAETHHGSRVDGLFSPVIERNTLVPVSRVEGFYPITDEQTAIRLNIYQGEHRHVRDNILLGTLNVELPKRPERERGIDVRFTYDTSGLLEIEVTVKATGEKSMLTVMGNNASLTDDEIAQIKRSFDQVKIHPRDELPNASTMSRAERAYAEHTGDQREAIGQAITEFGVVLAKQDRELAAKHRKRLERWLDELEARHRMFPLDSE